jgi:hypothetical protein
VDKATSAPLACLVKRRLPAVWRCDGNFGMMDKAITLDAKVRVAQRIMLPRNNPGPDETAMIRIRHMNAQR